MWPAGYDNKGNVFVEGQFTNIAVCWLPVGAKAMRAISFNQGIRFPGSVMWDGKFVTLTDQNYSGSQSTAIYEVTRSRGALAAVRTVALSDTCTSQFSDVQQPFIVGRKNTPANDAQSNVVVGGNLYCGNRFDYWAFPSGGNPTSSLISAPLEPYGQSVSILTP